MVVATMPATFAQGSINATLNNTALNDTALNNTTLNNITLSSAAVNETVLDKTALNLSIINNATVKVAPISEMAKVAPEVAATASAVCDEDQSQQEQSSGTPEVSGGSDAQYGDIEQRLDNGNDQRNGARNRDRD